MSKVQIDEHVEITDSLIELLHLVVGGEQGVELEHAVDSRGQRRQPAVAQIQLRHPGQGGDGVRQCLQLVIMKIQYLKTQQIGDLETEIYYYISIVFGDIHLWRNAGYLVACQNELGQVDCVPPVVGVVGVHGDAGDHALHLLRVQLHQGPHLVGHAGQPPVAEVQLARPPRLLHHLGVEVLGVLAAVVQCTL